MSVLKLFASTFALSSLLLTQPVFAQDSEAKEDETVGQMIDRLLRQSEERRKDLAEKGREAAREAEEALIDSDILGEMEARMQAFGDRLELERGEGDGTALFFDGDELLRFRRELERDIDDRVTISGLGRNLSVERETVTKNGKTKTRIVIEMDGGEELEIDLPAHREETESDQE